MSELQDLMLTGVCHHRQGDLPAAGRIYQQVIELDARHADAWHLSGLVAHQQGMTDRALECLDRAIRLRGHVADYHANRASVLMSVSQPHEAEVSCRRALKLQPDHALAWSVLGNALWLQHRNVESLEALVAATHADPRNAEAWTNLASVQLRLGKLDAALTNQDRALSLQPQQVQGLINRGAMLRHLGELSEARRTLEFVLRLQPDSCEAMVNLANVLRESGQLALAMDRLNRALELDPRRPTAWVAAGICYQEAHDIPRAIACFEEAIQYDPMNDNAWSDYLYALNLDAECSRQRMFDAHLQWAGLIPEDDRRPDDHSHLHAAGADKRLRIGYVSPDLYHHAMRGFVMPIFESYDRKRFEVYCYAEVLRPDATTQTQQKLVDGWRFTSGLSDEMLAGLIRQDEIDILVDLAGHTARNRLKVFAKRPAPVQASMLGYLNTTGLAHIDYVITDVDRDPPEDDQYYSEQVWRLPHGGCCWQPPKSTPELSPRDYDSARPIVFGSTHKPDKMSSQTLAMWAKLLAVTPDSRLLVFRNSLRDNLELQSLILQRLVEFGVEPQRVDFAWDDSGEHLTAYGAMDILLDAIPWGSGTTALEAMWMGVPTPTVRGDRPCGRATASALVRLGLDDLIARDADDYVQCVARLAADRSRLQSLSSQLRTMMACTICDPKPYIADLQDAYRQMWQASLQQQSCV
ncbi:MAG: tetratricopeptide repeat protein [Pirellulaceae bacterium]|nr:tetratricopeptide repeat protein [Planctomycetales bacterium]